MSLRMSKYERFRTGSISSPENPFTTVRRRNYFGLSYLILQSRYKISNRLKVDNAAFCKPSDINPITGNPIYRDFFTHSGKLNCLPAKPFPLIISVYHKPPQIIISLSYLRCVIPAVIDSKSYHQKSHRYTSIIHSKRKSKSDLSHGLPSE